MKKYFRSLSCTLLYFLPIAIVAQNNTEVFLFDLAKDGTLKNQRNISNNPGYDSQPSFYTNNKILFASNRKGQTDIVLFDSKTNTRLGYLSNTPGGGEYSPQRIPRSKNVSAVRLDTTGLQRFYSYDHKTKEPTELIAGLKVAYPMWYDKNTVVSAVIGKKGLELVISNLISNTNDTLQKKVGRSFHHIPNSNLVSYISKQNEQWEIRSLNIQTKQTKKIVNTSGDHEDICWLPDGTVLQAKGNKILKFNPKTDTQWSFFHLFEKGTITNISRIRVNKTGRLIAIVAQENP